LAESSVLVSIPNILQDESALGEKKPKRKKRKEKGDHC